jgi:hypothetical protein
MEFLLASFRSEGARREAAGYKIRTARGCTSDRLRWALWRLRGQRRSVAASGRAGQRGASEAGCAFGPGQRCPDVLFRNRMPGHTAAGIAVRGGRCGDGVLLAVPEGRCCSGRSLQGLCEIVNLLDSRGQNIDNKGVESSFGVLTRTASCSTRIGSWDFVVKLRCRNAAR